MPKKINANTKAVEAKARKQEKIKCEKELKQKAIEDKYWKDDDKHANKKLQRKEDKEAKKIQHLDKKNEIQNLHYKEISGINNKKEPTEKVTHYQLEESKRKIKEAAGIKKKVVEVVEKDEHLIPENLNILGSVDDETRNFEETLKIFNTKDKLVRHVEKKIKGAFAAFEELRLPELKKENPGLRLSQLKQILFKEFEKSSENPRNQCHVDYNFKIEKNDPSLD